MTPEREEVARKAWEEGPSYHFINSWDMNEHESDAVAIRSTYKRLRNSTVNYCGLPIHLIVVKYLDYTSGSWAIPETDPLAPFAFKRKSFEHEHELRAVLQAAEYGHEVRMGRFAPREGWTVEAPLEVLIESITVAPRAPEWFRALVESVTQRYGLPVDVKRSTVAEEPVY
jgi:hypothetical protein